MHKTKSPVSHIQAHIPQSYIGAHLWSFTDATLTIDLVSDSERWIRWKKVAQATSASGKRNEVQTPNIPTPPIARYNDRDGSQ